MNDAVVPYEIGLLEDLADPAEAMAYLGAALEDGDKALTRSALSHVIEAQEIGQDDDERMKLAQSKQLRAILDAAEARIRATGGIKHEDFWSQLDAEYKDADAQVQATSAGGQKKGATESHSKSHPGLSPTPVVAVAEPKADYQVNTD